MKPVLLAIAFLIVLPVRLSAQDIPATVAIPAGTFLFGSDAAEREMGYQLDEAAYGHSRTREWGWYDREFPRQERHLPAYEITTTPITNAQYAFFLAETGHAAPEVSAAEWQSYRLIHPFERTRRHAWIDGVLPKGREAHPVVMVSLTDAWAYADWLSERTGETWRLPSEEEWERTARGTDGRAFPWGAEFDATLLNSHDTGPFDTMPVGSFPQGASPSGALDTAGHVFEWTSTAAGEGRHIVKGGSWDDSGCGICRPAARHSRPDGIKHILIGFRLVRLRDE